MSKFIRFIPQVYMIICMTFTISLIHYLLGHGNFIKIWMGAIVVAAPLAFFFSYWIGPIMKKLNAHRHQ
ncbi:DUF2798 domain-containing protein [Lachnospiraceae bacterium OttesenSCG-928-E19]|nr:DUF2798 domain-containing protein [Lachnospiraceae bacterium OttesenSCG-928-E19]